jgi:hypothetical protein
MRSTEWFDELGLGRNDSSLLSALRKERVVFDPAKDSDLTRLRADGLRIARDMNDAGRPPPMLWSGIPLPYTFGEPSCDYQLVISVGGTKTEFALLRLEDGVLWGLDL